MARLEALRVGVGETRLEDGTRIIVQTLESVHIEKSPSATSQHEAWHALAALLLGISVDYLTNIPEGDSLGHTKVGGFHPIIAAAAHAMGCDGSGHDLMMIEMSGNNVGGATEGARSLLAGRVKEMLAIATMLDEKKKMGGGEVTMLANAVDKETREGKLYIVRIIGPDGKEKTREKRSLDGEMVIDLPIEKFALAA